VVKEAILSIVLLTSAAALAADPDQNPPPQKPSVTERCRAFLADASWAVVKTLANTYTIMTYPLGFQAIRDITRFDVERSAYNKALIVQELSDQNLPPYLHTVESLTLALQSGISHGEIIRNIMAGQTAGYTMAKEKLLLFKPQIEELLDSQMPNWRKDGVTYFEPGRPLRLYTRSGTLTKKFEYGSFLVIAQDGIVLGKIEYQPAMKLTILE